MICTDAKVSERKYVLFIFKFHQHRSETQTRVVSVGRVGCQRNSRLLFNSIFINNSRFRLSISTAQSRFSITTQLFSQSDSFLFYRLTTHAFVKRPRSLSRTPFSKYSAEGPQRYRWLVRPVGTYASVIHFVPTKLLENPCRVPLQL